MQNIWFKGQSVERQSQDREVLGLALFILPASAKWFEPLRERSEKRPGAAEAQRP